MRCPRYQYLLIFQLALLFSCGTDKDTNKSEDRTVNVIKHNEVFQTEVANELNDAGLLFAQREEYDKAREKFLVALKYEENNPTLLNNLGLTEKAVGNIAKACEYFEQAMKADTAYYNAYTNYALVLLEEKRYKKSLSLLKKAIKYSKSDLILASAHLHATFVYYDLGKCEKARYHFEKSKMYSDNSRETVDQLNMVEKKLEDCK